MDPGYAADLDRGYRGLALQPLAYQGVSKGSHRGRAGMDPNPRYTPGVPNPLIIRSEWSSKAIASRPIHNLS